MRKIIIISDFDGTITKKDSLVEILNRFASPEWHKIARLVKSGRLGTKIGLRKELDLCKVTKKEFIAFLIKNIKIDSTFKNFLEFCKKNKIKFLVVSGGFGLNVKTIFKKSGIQNIPYYANIITFNKDIVKLKFPYKDKGCKTCSLCKAPYIKRYKKKDFLTIYVGDSVTDRCPVKVADLVFAKDDLVKYCKAKGIAFVPYKNFGDIRRVLARHILGVS